MKKAHTTLVVGGIVSAFTAGLGIIMGKFFMDKTAALKSVGKVAGEFGSGDDEMGAEDDPIVQLAKTL